MIPSELTCVDLFSGIGGVAMGLKATGAVKTIAYCEVNPYCQSVLVERMKEGKLDKAPIHSDIKTLHLSNGPTMLCGGFPCTDISSIGLRKGIDESTHSGLFLEIMRLVDEAPSIQVLFLENVSNIVKCGFEDVMTHLHKRGFVMCWKMMSANQLGAPHQRLRWFCLAVRGSFDLSKCNEISQEMPGNWWSNNREPQTKIAYKPTIREDPAYDTFWIQRCQALGNAAVPCVVERAFNDLVHLYKALEFVKVCFSSAKVPMSELSYPFPQSGIIVDGMYFGIPGDYHNYKNPMYSSSICLSLKYKNQTITLNKLPTPRHGITHPSSLTDRTIHDLPTILVHCDSDNRVVGDKPLHSISTPNVNYIEWMMGFPADWTKIRGEYVKTSGNQRINKIKKITPSAVGNIPQKASSRLNGMHMLMKEHPGKSVKEMAKIWKELSQNERDKYSQSAKKLKSNAIEEMNQNICIN